MTMDERERCLHKQRWPGPNERAVVVDMLNDPDSPHWTACREFVERLVWRNNCPPALREDVVQESMLSVLLSLREFRLHCSLATWLMTIVRRRVIDATRGEMRKGQRELAAFNALESDSEAGGEGDIATSRTTEEECLLREELQSACAHVEEYVREHVKPDRNSQILNLVLLQGFSVAEAAARLGVPSPTASYVVHSARVYLRERRK